MLKDKLAFVIGARLVQAHHLLWPGARKCSQATQTNPACSPFPRPPLPPGVSNVAVTAFWLGRWPGTYHYFWLLKDVVLFTLRFLVYRREGMHYM